MGCISDRPFETSESNEIDPKRERRDGGVKLRGTDCSIACIQGGAENAPRSVIQVQCAAQRLTARLGTPWHAHEANNHFILHGLRIFYKPQRALSGQISDTGCSRYRGGWGGEGACGSAQARVHPRSAYSSYRWTTQVDKSNIQQHCDNSM